MYKKTSEDSIRSLLIDQNSKKSQIIQQQSNVNDENTEVLIDSDNEDEFTSSGISEDENITEEENHFEQGNILQPLNQCNHRHNLSNMIQNVNMTYIQTEGVFETTQMNNDHLLAQTMAVLASKHQHTKPLNSSVSEEHILSFVGPCPLYSLGSSFGLDMHHGLSYFPCRDVLANGGGHPLARPLWQHLTSYHNLNLSSSSLIITHLLVHGYSSSTPILFNSTDAKTLLRTTPRYSLMKRCPLTRYNIYGIQYEHGTRLCSGYTYNTNIYLHLISFHKMTHDASLHLSRAIAFNDKQFKFNSNEQIVNEYIKCSLLKYSQRNPIPRFRANQCHLFKKILPKKPVKNSSN